MGFGKSRAARLILQVHPLVVEGSPFMEMRVSPSVHFALEAICEIACADLNEASLPVPPPVADVPHHPLDVAYIESVK